MNIEQRKAFVRSHRTCVFGYARQHDGPAMTIVYYVMDGDDILVSTMAERAKARAVLRNPKVSLCVLDEQWPPSYLLVYCNATIDATVETNLEAVLNLRMRIAALMAGHPMPESARTSIRETSIAEQRVVLRLRPYATFETPPRHVHSAKDLEGLTHWLEQSLPWTENM